MVIRWLNLAAASNSLLEKKMEVVIETRLLRKDFDYVKG